MQQLEGDAIKASSVSTFYSTDYDKVTTCGEDDA
jgi:hypothetical protein